MFRAKIDISKEEFNKLDFEIDTTDRGKSILFNTEKQMFLANTVKIKGAIDKYSHIISMIYCEKYEIIDIGYEDISGDKFKKILNEKAIARGMSNYKLQAKGFITGVIDGYIVFIISQIILMPCEN